MRRFDESHDNEFAETVKLGEDNAECLRQMQSWCKHVEIERTSEGLYAQMTGLPIAGHSVACPKVEDKSESMNLRWIFSDFLVENCATCPHHIPNGDPSWGQEIIDKHREEAHKREQEDKKEADRIFKLRSELRSKSRDISAETAPESHRILKYLEAIFSEDETERKEASERLEQSARIGADLFPNAAIELILLLAGSNEFSELLLPVCKELANRRLDLETRLSHVSLDNIEKGLHIEQSASVLDALDDSVGYPLDEVYITKLLLSQDHDLIRFSDEPDYSHSTAIIIRSFDADPDSVQNIVRRELQNESDHVRVYLCRAIKLIQEVRPQIAINLLDALAQSLELYENARSGYEQPSKKIIQILQSAFRHSTDRVDLFLVEAMTHVRPAVQEDIVDIYRDQFFDRTISWEKRDERRNRTEVSEPEEVAIQRLLSWVKDERLEIDIRVQVVEALGTACAYASAEMIHHFDSILGYFAIISDQEHPPDPPPRILLPGQPQSNQLEQLDEFSRTQKWSAFKDGLQKCLAELCKIKPSEAFDSICGCLSQPSAHLEDDFKACCISLLGELGKDYTLRPQVLPLIWRALMDYDSDWVRSQAIGATVEMFSFSASSPPANLVDTIIVHLQDPKIVVYQAALQAVSRRPRWFDEKQSFEALKCLERHLHAYRNEKYQLDDICSGILSVSRRYERLKPFALRLVESIFPTDEYFVDKKIAEALIGFCEPDDENAALVAKDIGAHLANHDRDRYNYYGYSERLRMFEWLHQLPEDTYHRVADNLLTSAKKIAEHDVWELCHFASLFSHFQAFRYEQAVLESAVNSVPEEPRHETSRANLHQLAMIAAGNAALQDGDTEKAEAYFAKGKGRA
ncbi:MAG: hypothetical protein F4Y39_07520 [Gemmatimonadetes bacterium]|nr:hypothetical protein [Gemmatimonadota bacterium]MYK53517.1 hypothetical protein [Gemmatimonadota bacterium]